MKKIKEIEKRLDKTNRIVFENMLDLKKQTDLQVDKILNIITSSKKAIFPPMKLFGFEKIFNKIVFAQPDTESDYKDSDCIFLWGHHVSSTRADMILHSQMYHLPLILMEDGFIRSIYPNAKKMYQDLYERAYPTPPMLSVIFLMDMALTEPPKTGPP